MFKCLLSAEQRFLCLRQDLDLDLEDLVEHFLLVLRSLLFTLLLQLAVLHRLYLLLSAVLLRAHRLLFLVTRTLQER